MQRVRSATENGGGAHMQWLCEASLLDEALRTAALLERSHPMGVDVWRVDDWGALVEEGVACERQWLQGLRPQIDSRVAHLLAATHGPILALTRGQRSTPELLRAFMPPGRRYLSVGAADAAAIVQAAVRLAEDDSGEWIRLAVT
jgi:pyruvate dehydrogenase E1 component